MTVSSSTARVSYEGNGSTTGFAVPFRFLANGHVKAVLRQADGTELTWAETTHYTLTGAGNAAGGTLTALVAPAAAERLVILRNVPRTQETDYVEGDPFPAETHEAALDKLTMIVQQIVEQIARSLVLPETSSLSGIKLPEPGAGKIWRWNGAGTALEVVDAGALGVDVVAAGLAADDLLLWSPADAAFVNRTPPVVLRTIGAPFNTVQAARTAAYTLAAGDKGTVVPVDASAGAVTITAPPAATAGAGYAITLLKTDASANAVIFDPDAAELVGGRTSCALAKRYDAVTFVCDGAGWLIQADGGPAAAKTDRAQTFTAGQRGAVTPLTDGATIAVDLAQSNNFTVTLAGNRTLADPTNAVAGQAGTIAVIQDATGGRTLSFGPSWKFESGTAPTLTAAPNAVDVLAYHVRSATEILAVPALDLR